MGSVKWVVMSVLAVSLVACSGEKAKEKSFVLDGDETVRAEVNGEKITLYDVEQSAVQTLGAANASKLDETGKEKIVKSLAASRAIAQARTKEMTPKQRAEFAKQVAVYREQLLVRQYLAKHATPSRVSSEMVERWYHDHPERFGAESEITYEMVAADTRKPGSDRDELMAVMGGAAKAKAWGDWAFEQRELGHPVLYKKGRAVKGVMDERLYALINATKQGETSPLTYIEGEPYLVRVLDRKNKAPRPLAEVRAEIRRALAPVKVKEAVRQVSDEVLKSADVVYY